MRSRLRHQMLGHLASKDCSYGTIRHPTWCLSSLTRSQSRSHLSGQAANLQASTEADSCAVALAYVHVIDDSIAKRSAALDDPPAHGRSYNYASLCVLALQLGTSTRGSRPQTTSERRFPFNCMPRSLRQPSLCPAQVSDASRPARTKVTSSIWDRMHRLGGSPPLRRHQR